MLSHFYNRFILTSTVKSMNRAKMRQSHFLITKERSIYMPKPKTATGEKNLISKRLIELREKNHMSQRMLAHQLQLRGYDMDKNVITRIETNKRFVTDVEIKAFSEVFEISYEYLIDGKEK